MYPLEILPLKIRAKGTALALRWLFLGNFLAVEITPPAFQNIGYNMSVIFAVPSAANAVIVWCFYPETGGQPLESIEKLFVENESGDTSGSAHPSEAAVACCAVSS